MEKSQNRYSLAHINIVGQKESMKGIYDSKKEEVVVKFDNTAFNVRLALELIKLANNSKGNRIKSNKKDKYRHQWQKNHYDDVLPDFFILEVNTHNFDSIDVIHCDTAQEAEDMVRFLNENKIRFKV